jgi:hypothetical protein
LTLHGSKDYWTFRCLVWNILKDNCCNWTRYSKCQHNFYYCFHNYF